MKRVCHVCLSHPADDGRVFGRACTSLAAAGFDVHLLARSSSMDVYEDQGVAVHPQATYRSRLRRLGGGYQVAQAARELKADLYHVHEPELLGPILAAVGDRPVIWDVHEPYLTKIYERPWIPAPLKAGVRFAWDIGERLMLGRCAAVVTVSTLLAKRYLPLHRRVCVVHNYPRAGLTSFAPPSYALKSAGTCVFAGTLAASRAVLQMIQAIAILKRRGVKADLELAGVPESKAFEAEFLEAVSTLGVSDRVRFRGRLSRMETVRLQAECGVGLEVSPPNAGNRVGYPVKMFELMALGTPLVYSNLPTFRAVAGEAGCGLAVDPFNLDEIADAIQVLATNPEVAERLGNAGRAAIAERFNWEREWPKLLELYISLIGAASGPQG